ncbi:MAG: IMS domain-containing protein [Halothece sp.]
MRIPLDYYRIIGGHLQATAEQIEQAYQDRLRQTPHSEYSQETLAARKELLDLAYEVLSDPEQRSEYDANYLLKAYNITTEEEGVALPHIQREEEEAVAIAPQTPILEIETPEQLLGALLILYEVGEYERVRDLARWVLAHPERATSSQDHPLSQSMQADLVLTLVLAHWELGRELWRQEQYEAAGEAVVTGYELLEDWNLFPRLRQEMASELEKLSPYRIFELLSQRDEDEEKVRLALQLLETMLEKRGGIDGEIPDRSGLNVEEFLHFVQQIRSYLTAAEQEELFTKEAQRPSGVGMYLAACAATARGFAYLEPNYIFKAKRFFRKLERDHQQENSQTDVKLEQSVCALLLGETETAISQIEKSRDQSSIAQIQSYASEAEETPDLLLGLCRYAEEWLESVLFPKFLDLRDKSASLKDYFASSSVQETLESYQSPPSSENEETETQVSALPESSSGGSESSHSSERTKPSLRRQRKRRPTRQLRPSTRASRMVALLLMGGVGLSAIALILFGLYRGATALWASLFQEGERFEIAIELNNPLLEIPSPDSNNESSVILDEAIAEEIVRDWLSHKAQAFGPQYEEEAFEDILTDSLLSQWQDRSQSLENNNFYQQFRHSVQIESLAFSPDNPNEGQITAEVREVSNFYRDGELSEEDSYDSTLRVRYDVVRDDETWLIDRIEVISDQ